MSPEETSVKFLRTIHSVLLFSVPLYAFIGQGLARRTYRPNTPVAVTFSVVAAVALLAGLLARTRLVQPARTFLHDHGGDPDALAHWRSGSLISLVACESVALCGFALRLIGHPLAQALPFYLAAVVLMLAWTPRLDAPAPPPEDG